MKKTISTTLTPKEELPRIDPALIPDYIWDRWCTDLYKSITEVLANPALRQEYENWKKERNNN